jgi:hypothetical protein
MRIFLELSELQYDENNVKLTIKKNNIKKIKLKQQL